MISHFDREQLIWNSGLSTNEAFLLLALNSFVDANGECWPGQELLARRCKFSDRTVRNTCKKLEQKGIIVRNHRQSKSGQRTSDKFRILFSAIPNQPEGDSTRANRKEIPLGQNQPENFAKPTGKFRQNQPEGFSRDLSSKNYPEELSREEEEAPSFCSEEKTETGLATLDSSQPEGIGQSEEVNVPPPKVGVVTYRQPPESIDLSELWEVAEYEAKAKARALAPGHRYPALVAHGLGAIWVGPNVSDFDPDLLALIGKNKKAGNHRHDRAACVEYISRAVRDRDWAKLEANWLEVVEQRRRAIALVVPITQRREQQASPPPKDWAKKALGARYRDAG